MLTLCINNFYVLFISSISSKMIFSPTKLYGGMFFRLKASQSFSRDSSMNQSQLQLASVSLKKTVFSTATLRNAHRSISLTTPLTTI